MKLRRWVSADGAPAERGLMWYCPGCESGHKVRLEGAGDKWGFDGNEEAPTFTPSVLTTSESYGDWPARICHVFISGGQIQFLSDSTHELAGKTVPLPEWPY